MRGIYIRTRIAGRRSEIVTEFAGRTDFFRYACEVRPDAGLSSRLNIDQICEALEDCGPGFGQRTHSRISAVDAKKIESD